MDQGQIFKFLKDKFVNLQTNPLSIKIVWDMGKDDGLSNGSLSPLGYSNGTTEVLNYTLKYSTVDEVNGTSQPITVGTTPLTELVVTNLNINSTYRFWVVKNTRDIDDTTILDTFLRFTSITPGRPNHKCRFVSSTDKLHSYNKISSVDITNFKTQTLLFRPI